MSGRSGSRSGWTPRSAPVTAGSRRGAPRGAAGGGMGGRRDGAALGLRPADVLLPRPGRQPVPDGGAAVRAGLGALLRVKRLTGGFGRGRLCDSRAWISIPAPRTLSEAFKRFDTRNAHLDNCRGADNLP